MTEPTQTTPGAEAALTAARAARDMFLQLTPARVDRDAERAERNGGALAGVPFAVKDVFDVTGTRTSGASQLLDRRQHARADAEAVRRLAAAGAVCIGKTTLSELAYSGLGVNDRFGTPTLHLAGLDRLVGGSSSGSAAAVRAGIVPIALASDTSGSARIPAAWAGIYGFRPSTHRYPDAGMLPLAPTLDTVGIVAADAAGLITVDTVLARDSRPAEEAQAPRFMVPHDAYLDGCDATVLERFHATIDALRARGLRVEHRRFEALDLTRALHAMHMPIVEEEALAAYGHHLHRHPERFGPAVRRRLERARSRSREQSAEPLRAAMPALRERFHREIGDAILLTPPTEIEAPTLQQVRTSPDTEDALNGRALRLTMALSYLNSPSGVMPVDLGSRSELTSASLQLSARSGADRRVLAAIAGIDALAAARKRTADPITSRTSPDEAVVARPRP
jgi:aspartyl-tRNA(Asn)/glutamyl-tRNA(Gln) amidotransferase subunit A